MLCTEFKILAFFSIFLLFSCTTQKKFVKNNNPQNLETQSSLSFDQIWAYLHDGQENELTTDMPISDIGYFGAYIDHYGKLFAVPQRKDIAFFNGRVHLVVVCNHAGMTHMVLSPEYPLRNQLIDDLVSQVKTQNFEGIQIDFELVLANDKKNFLLFLQDLKVALNNQLQNKENVPVLSVAVPARTRYLTKDAYDYEAIGKIADIVFIMAYDEHWSNGTPGPVASFDWSKNIAHYALDTITAQKIVMGQPFYGRTWGSVQGNRAFFYSGMMRQIREFNVHTVKRENGILTFNYSVPLKITAYFDDIDSLKERSKLYQNLGIKHTGFWCLGQENKDFWQEITLKNINHTID